MAVTHIDVVPGWFDTELNYDRTGRPSELLVFTESGLVSRPSLPEGVAFEDGPRAVSLELEEPLPARELYLMVTRIEGDTRTHAAIGEITVRGTPVSGGKEPSAAVIDWRAVVPRVTESAACGASD